MGRTKRKRRRKLINKTPIDSNLIWLKKWLGLKNQLQICTFQGTGRGIMSLRKVPEGEELIAIPLKYVINVKTSCDIFSILSINDRSPQLTLTLLLVYEAHLQEKSQFAHYIKVLPQKYTTLFFCNAKEVEKLPRFLQATVMEQITTITACYERLTEELYGKFCPHCDITLKDIFCYERFTWGWFTVNTRAVYYKDDVMDSLALAPFLDMFNHSNNAETEADINIHRGVYVLRTLKPYSKYEQIFIKYGPHSNVKLLLEYGFILPKNPHDYVAFDYQEIIKTVKEYDTAYGEISKLKYNFIIKNNLYNCLRKYREEFSWNYNGLLYVLTTQDEDIAVIQSKTYSSQFTTAENFTINQISTEIINKKLQELHNELQIMESFNNCTESFNIAKELMKMHINLLS